MRKFMITVNGATYEVDVEEVNGDVSKVVSEERPASRAAAPVISAPKAVEPKVVTDGETIKAPMPGTVLDVKAQVGASIKKGDVLLVLEAMKMENEIMAPRDAQVMQVLVNKGATVNTGDALVVLK